MFGLLLRDVQQTTPNDSNKFADELRVHVSDARRDCVTLLRPFTIGSSR